MSPHPLPPGAKPDWAQRTLALEASEPVIALPEPTLAQATSLLAQILLAVSRNTEQRAADEQRQDHPAA